MKKNITIATLILSSLSLLGYIIVKDGGSSEASTIAPRSTPPSFISDSERSRILSEMMAVPPVIPERGERDRVVKELGR
jgi:hypothetical protein